MANAGLFTCRSGDQVELDVYFVGNGGDVRPDTVADGEIEPFEDEGAVEETIVAFLSKSDRCNQILCLALDRQFARKFVLIATQRTDCR